jgi:MvdD-like protein with pre-ATP grasp domain
VILVVTNRSDQTADWLILELTRRRTPFVRFNTEDYPCRVGLRWTVDGAGSLQLPHTTLDLATVSAVWYRRPLPPDPISWTTRRHARWALGESRAAIEGIWRELDAIWVNHPDKNRAAASKIEQLKRARSLGMTVPQTLVTNEVASLRAFAGTHADADMICKPLEEGLLEVADQRWLFLTSPFRLDADDPLDDLGPEPYLFQELIPKQYDIRVTVIGTRIFATRIESQRTEKGKTDWRAAGRQAGHSVEVLPTDVEEQCLRLCRSYGLEFAAIDLARTPSGDHVFFEVNPNGQWAWIEQLTGQPLRATLADLLEGIAA